MPFLGANVVEPPLMAGETVLIQIEFQNNQDSTQDICGQVTWDNEFIYNSCETLEGLESKTILKPVTVPNSNQVELDYTGPTAQREVFDVSNGLPSNKMGIIGGPSGIPDTVEVGEEFSVNFGVSCPSSGSCSSSDLVIKKGIQNAFEIASSTVQGMSAGGQKTVSTTMSFDNTGSKVIQWELNDTNRVGVIEVEESSNTKPSVDITNINKGPQSVTPDVAYSDPENNIEQIMWSLKRNGSEIATSTSRNPSFEGLPDGSYNLSVKVTDAGGLSGEDNSTFGFTAQETDTPPSVTLTGVNKDGLSVSPTAQASDEDGEVVSFNWLLMDGVDMIDQKGGRSPTLTADQPGTYLLAVGVVDNDGNRALDKMDVELSRENEDEMEPSQGLTRNQMIAGAVAGAGLLVVVGD